METTIAITVERYFKALNEKNGWEDLIADDMDFTGMKTKTQGKADYVKATTGFLNLVKTVTIEKLIAQDGQVCVLAHYELAAPSGKTMNCAIAEIFTVKNGQLSSSTIFFDTAGFNEFLA